MKIKGNLLAGRVFDKKDGSGKCLAVDVLFYGESLVEAQVIKLFSGDAYVGEYDLSVFTPLELVEVEYDQKIGSQYPKLVNLKKIK